MSSGDRYDRTTKEKKKGKKVSQVTATDNSKMPLGVEVSRVSERKHRGREQPVIWQLLHLSPQPFDEATQGYEANQTPWQPLPQQTQAVFPVPTRLKVSVRST